MLTIVGQNGPVTTSLSVLVARSAPGAMDALGPVVAAGPFGVGKSLAVILVALGIMFFVARSLGGGDDVTDEDDSNVDSNTSRIVGWHVN